MPVHNDDLGFVFRKGTLFISRAMPGTPADVAQVNKFAGHPIGAINGKRVRTKEGLKRVWDSIDPGSDAVFRFRMKWNNHPGAESFDDWWPEWYPEI